MLALWLASAWAGALPGFASPWPTEPLWAWPAPPDAAYAGPCTATSGEVTLELAYDEDHRLIRARSPALVEDLLWSGRRWLGVDRVGVAGLLSTRIGIDEKSRVSSSTEQRTRTETHTTTWDYDNQTGLLAEIARDDGTDAFKWRGGEVVRVDHGHGENTRYTWDAGRVVLREERHGGKVSARWRYAWDGEGRLAAITAEAPDPAVRHGFAPIATVALDYACAGR